MKNFEEYLDKIGYSWKDFDRTCEMVNLIEQYADERVKQSLNTGSVSAMLPSINSSTFKNYLKLKGYVSTLNPLVYKKQGIEYDKEILHRHFLNEIEFGS